VSDYIKQRWTPSVTLEEDFDGGDRPAFKGRKSFSFSLAISSRIDLCSAELRPTTPVMRFAMARILEERGL